MVRIFVCLLCFYTLGGFANEVYVLRAPRSGSHWFSYCLNIAFERNVNLVLAFNNPNPSSPQIKFAHNPYDLQLTTDSDCEDLLILLVRNYRECLLREYRTPEVVKTEILHQATFNHLAHDREWVFHLHQNHYFHLLRVYDLWSPHKRLLIYYEDLLQNPLETLTHVALFLGEEDKIAGLESFIDNIEEHQEKCLKNYEKGYNSHTRGKSLSYHSQKIGNEQAQEIDHLVLECFPHFVQKYLFRYL